MYVYVYIYIIHINIYWYDINYGLLEDRITKLSIQLADPVASAQGSSSSTGVWSLKALHTSAALQKLRETLRSNQLAIFFGNMDTYGYPVSLPKHCY
jgi:hypothetical protein